MISLIGVEMRRGLARRSTRGLLAVAVIGIAAIGVGIFLSSRATVDAGGFVQDKRFHLTDLWALDEGGDSILQVTAVFLAIGAVMGGATFIGGEWRWGTVTTLLTWEPRRTRVFLAKAAATLVLTFLIGIILQALVGLSVLPAALWRGTTAGADAEWSRAASGAVLRASALGAGAAALGYAVASIGRNTAAALGVAFAYVSVFESLVRGLKPGWQRWLIGDNAAVFLTARELRPADFERTVLEAGLILSAYLAAILGAGALVFSRRDVT